MFSEQQYFFWEYLSDPWGNRWWTKNMSANIQNINCITNKMMFWIAIYNVTEKMYVSISKKVSSYNIW